MGDLVNSTADDLADAREEAWRNLGAVAHYVRVAQSFLEYGDDIGVIYALQHAREYWRSAMRNIEPCRAAMRQRIEGEGGGDNALR